MGKQFVDTASVVGAYFDAFRDRRRGDAETVIADTFTFTSPFDDRLDRAAFFARCWPTGDQFAQFQVERIATDQDGAFVRYLCTTKEGLSFRNTEYLTVRNHQVTSADVYFGASYRSGAFVKQQEDGHE